MSSQTIGRRQLVERKAPWLWLGLILVTVGLALTMFIAVSQWAAADDHAATSAEHGLALHIYRAGEWRLYDYPRATDAASMGAYRAGERAPYGWAAGTAAGLSVYRAGERSLLEPGVMAPPAGWADYRAGERALDPR